MIMKPDVPVSSMNTDAAPGALNNIDGQQMLISSDIPDAMHRQAYVTRSMDLAPERRRTSNTEELRKRRDEQLKAWNAERDQSRQPVQWARNSATLIQRRRNRRKTHAED